MIAKQQFESTVVSIQAMASVFVLLAWQFGEASWLGCTLFVGLAVAVLSIIANLDNILFFSRTVFIAWIGLIPALALYMGGYFAYRMPFVQTMYVAFVLTIITTLSLFSSQIGIEAGEKIGVRQRGVDLPGNERITLYFMLALLVLVGTLIAMGRGELIFFVGYASERQHASQVHMPIQNLQSIATILMLFSLVLYFRLEWIGRLSATKRRRLCSLMVLVGIYVAYGASFFAEPGWIC